MSVQPVNPTRASNRAGKKQAAPKTDLPTRRSLLDIAIEDDDWVPLAAKLPARVVGEFIDNDYDMM